MKQTRNPNTLTNLTKMLNGNRGIAERFLNNISYYVDEEVENGELEDINDDEELKAFFEDVVAEGYKRDDEIRDLVTALGALNHQYTNRVSDSYGYLAELMREYYRSEYEGGINESKMNKNMKKNTIKLNESQLRKIVAESVQNVLLENCFHSSNPFETSDAEVNLKNAIHELKETVNILETFCKDGMNEKRLLKMAQAYGERGMRLLGTAVSSAR